MMNYLNTHPEEFSSSLMPFSITMMQFLGGFIAELTNLFMLATRETVENCITFFVAFHVLAAVDNIYAEGLSNFKLRKGIEEPLIYKRKPKQIKFLQRDCYNKLIRIVNKILSFFYKAMYYYFTPFLVNFIPYVWDTKKQI